MNLSKNLFALSAALLLTTVATAQRGVVIQRTVQSSGTSYAGSVGNSWLGASFDAHALMSLSHSIYSDNAHLDIGTSASATLLTASAQLALVSGVVNNGSSFGTQSRNGNFHVQVIGYDLINTSFSSDTSFGRNVWAYNLFPTRPSVSVPVGPVSITLSGNVGAGLITSAGYSLPVASLTVAAAGYAEAYGTANASVGVGIPGFGLGVGINGHILDSTINLFLGCTYGSGFFGSASLYVIPISLTLYAYAEAFWQRWTTNLTSWSSAAISYVLR